MERYLHLLKIRLGVTGTIEGRGEGEGQGREAGEEGKSWGEEAGMGEKATLSPSHRLPLLLRGNGETTTLYFPNLACVAGGFKGWGWG